MITEEAEHALVMEIVLKNSPDWEEHLESYHCVQKDDDANYVPIELSAVALLHRIDDVGGNKPTVICLIGIPTGYKKSTGRPILVTWDATAITLPELGLTDQELRKHLTDHAIQQAFRALDEASRESTSKECSERKTSLH